MKKKIKILTLLLLPFLFISCASSNNLADKRFLAEQTNKDSRPHNIRKGDNSFTVHKHMASKPNIIYKTLVGEHHHYELWIIGEDKRTGKRYAVVKSSKSIIKIITGIDPIRTWNDIISVITKKDISVRRMESIVKVEYDTRGKVISVQEKTAPRAHINIPISWR